MDTFLGMDRSEDVWNHLVEPPQQTTSWGDVPGKCQGREVSLPEVPDGGLLLRLLCMGGLGGESLAQLSHGAVWEVVSAQEKTRYVPGQRVWLDPFPPCGICPACLGGCSRKCADRRTATSFPGWMSTYRVLHPWAVRRGVVSVPATVAPALFTLLVPMARAMRVRRSVAKRDRVVVVGGGIQALLVGAALEGPGRRVLADSGFDHRQAKPLGFQQVSDRLEPLLDGLQGEPDLVVVAQDSPLAELAVQSAGWGAHIVSLVAPQGAGFPPSDKEATLHHQCSFTAEDLSLATRRIVEIAGFLSSLSPTTVRLEDWPAREFLEDPWTVVEACAPSF